jgi:FixJ family two-component response regulator
MKKTVNNQKQATVFIVDDDLPLREAMTMFLEHYGLHTQAYPDGASFLANYDGSQPGCVLLDQAMPGLSGLEVQAALLEKDMAIPVIFLTAHGSIQAAVSALKKHAFDFLEKPLPPNKLIDCVQRALAWDQQNSDAHSETIHTGIACKKLTPREYQVMQCILAGQTSKETALTLGLSHRTIEIFRSHIMAKMDVRNSAELATKASECQHRSRNCQRGRNCIQGSGAEMRDNPPPTSG